MKDSKMFLSMHKVPFGRRGSYMVFFLEDLAEEEFGMPKLWFGSCRGGASIQGRNNNLMRLSLVWNGEEIPYALSSTPSELIMDSDHGTVRICIAEHHLVRIYAEGEATLRWYWPIVGTHSNGKHEEARARLDGTWQAGFNFVANFQFVPLKGKMECEAPFDWRGTFCRYFKCDLIPENGIIDFALEEFPGFTVVKRDSYPKYQDCVRQVADEFQSFLDSTIPEIQDKEICKAREKAAWTTWTHITAPGGRIKRPMVRMMQAYFPHNFGWQQSYQAASLSKDPKLAWELLQSMFDHQTPDGHLPDYVNDMYSMDRTSKPPIQGYVYLWLMEHRDMSFLTKEQIEALYGPMVKWLEWWLQYSCTAEGLPFFGHPDESGWDDATVYAVTPQCISPELPPYLVLQMEALSDLAYRLGKDGEAAAWKKQAEDMLALFIKKLWNGKEFLAGNPFTGELFHTDNVVKYQPVILGKRLPQEIRDRMIADLKVEGEFLCPYGIASEKLDSGLIDPYQGWMNGPIVAPLHFQIVTGLDACGDQEFAKKVAHRFCLNCSINGPYHIINPFNGKGQDKGRDNVLHQHVAAWSTSIFLFLAGEYC
ncbi:MAG: hypothetical protein AB7E30_05185 [Lawsonibacter sp.]